ncbi:putative glucose oxidase [Aspergillus granulosus]|uniref:glucose oxidase n=1 Tax=Aspergillus granulosus TaxID=176169 RepID=A0ABR4H4H0_9EURO
MTLLHCLLNLVTIIQSTFATASTVYDYIIVGGGTAGLTVANRLSEDPTVSILVIESGQSQLDNPNVTDISRLAYTYDSPLDWAYETTEQAFGGRRQVMRAGRALGGTSVMNGAAYARGERIQLDALSTLGNANWTWDSLFPYYLKSEGVRLPNSTQSAAGASIIAAYHGVSGRISVGFTDIRRTENDFSPVLNRTFALLRVPWNRDLNSGEMRGFAMHPYTVDGDGVRSDAAAAYYQGVVPERRNLQSLLNASVSRILWGEERSENYILTARGVEVYEGTGNVRVVHARREVVLAAGAMRSAGILEASGIGNSRILKKHGNGISMRLDLPSVGENLQDQLNTSFVFSTKAPITGTRTVAFVSAADIFGPATASLAASLLADIPVYAERIADQSNGAMTKEALNTLYTSQHNLIFNHGIPIGEYVFILDNPHQVHVGYWGLLPFSRGSVHISSAGPLAPPTINPNFGMLDWDIRVQIAMSRFLRRILRTDEISKLVNEEVVPGLRRIPDDASDMAWSEWIAEQYTPNFHAVGSTSMLPRAMGGVVDNRFTVYGTGNVRIVDSSILPVQLCGHPTANIYAFAERAADMIQADWSGVDLSA